MYAQDAVNHATGSGSLAFPDLSRAQFEGIGNDADSDNPLAANVMPLFALGTGAGGRGMRTDGLTDWLLVRASALSRIQEVTLRRVSPPPVGSTGDQSEFRLVGIPREEVLDVLHLTGTPEYNAYRATTTASGPPSCAPQLEAVYDRAPAPLSDYRTALVARRRIIGRTVDGRAILMRTRTSARDFERASRPRERFP